MVYIFAFFGFMIGFGIGLGIINVILRHKSMDEIKSNAAYKWTYGLMVWGFALVGAWLGNLIFHHYFG